MARTLFDKVWDAHAVDLNQNGTQTFSALRNREISVIKPDQIVQTTDHNTRTINQYLLMQETLSKKQLEQLSTNCAKNSITLYELGHKYNGIVHAMRPELGITPSGMNIVCSASHTTTFDPFRAIAFGIGTSQVAQVFIS